MQPKSTQQPAWPDADRPTLLMVGSGEPMDAALERALDRHGLFVESVPAENLRASVRLTAPDAILFVGDAAADGGEAALAALAEDSSTGAVPVLILSARTDLEARMRAFRHGATAVVPRTASADAVARRVAELARELSEHFEERTGEIGEATFDELVELVKKELRSGILSVHAPGHEGGPMRVVLGAGRPVAEAVQEFVARLKPHVAAPAADSMYYQFHTSAGGAVELLEMSGSGGGDVEAFRSLRVLLVDDDPARADTLAQELRARGSLVFVTDTEGRGLERAVGLDPHVAIIDSAGLEGPGFEVVRSIRHDQRLKWASILVAPWDEVWPSGAPTPDMEQLASRIEPLLAADRELAARAADEDSFDVRFEATGPCRLLRTLVECGKTLHATVRSPRAMIEVDVAEQLVVGARARPAAGGEGEGAEGEGAEVGGADALATLLALGSGRVHVERRANPSVANVMSPVEEALAAATEATPAVAPSVLPPPKPQATPAGGVGAAAGAAPRPEAPPRQRTSSGEIRRMPRSVARMEASAARGLRPSDARWSEGAKEATDAGTGSPEVARPSAATPGRGTMAGGYDAKPTVRPPSPPVDPQEATRTPTPPRPSGRGEAGAAKVAKAAAKRPRRGTLLMGVPLDDEARGRGVDEAARSLDDVPTRRPPPSGEPDRAVPGRAAPGVGAKAAPSRKRKRPAATRRKTLVGVAPADLDAPTPWRDPTAGAGASAPVAEEASEPDLTLPMDVAGRVPIDLDEPFGGDGSEGPSEPRPIPAVRPPPSAPASAEALEPAAQAQEHRQPQHHHRQPQHRQPGPQQPQRPQAAAPVAQAASEAHEPARRGRAQTVAKAAVLLSGLVLAVALAIVGYRQSGARQPAVDDLLARVGLPPPQERPVRRAGREPEPARLTGSRRATTGETATDQTATTETATDHTATTETVTDHTATPETATDQTATDQTATGEPAAGEGTDPDAPRPEDGEIGEADAVGSDGQADEAGEPTDEDEDGAETGDEGNAQAEGDPDGETAAGEDAAEDEPSGFPATAEEMVARARRTGNDAMAERLYRRALELDPQEHHAMVGLARLLMDKNEHREAVDLMRGAVRRRSRRAAYRIWLGDALAGAGNRGAAVREWQEALELDPDNRQARRRLGQ